MSTLALPLSAPDSSLLVSAATYVTDAGRAGMRLGANGFVQVPGASAISLSKSFWLKGWVKAEAGATNSYLVIQFADAANVLSKSLGTNLSTWTQISLRQQVNTAGGVTVGQITLLINDSLVEDSIYPAAFGLPVGMAIYTDDATAVMGNVLLSDFSLDGTALIRPQFIGEVTYELVDTVVPLPPAPPSPTGSVTYLLNNRLLSSLGVIVSKSKGVLGLPERKPPVSFDWPTSHGMAVDLSRPRYLPRSITLECYVKASSPADLLTKVNALSAELAKPGTARLQINPFDAPPLVFEVYSLAAIEVEKRWKAGIIYGTFSLTLIEAQPTKRVFAFVGPGTVNFSFSCPDAVQIHWGDGMHDYDVFGTGQVISRTYTGTGTYYLILSGVMDKLTGLIHNATEL